MNDAITNDAAAIISTCSRLLSNLRTLSETDARAAVAACEAWLSEHPQPQQAPQALVSHSARSRLPQEILNLIVRNIPYEQRDTLLACSSVNREWRRISWRQLWKKYYSHRDLASTARHFSFPWALEVTRGVKVRDLSVDDPSESLDNLGLLFATPMFSGIRVLCLGYEVSTLNLLVALRSLPTLISLQCFLLKDEPVAWGENLELDEKKENEAWRVGLGNLRALAIDIPVSSDGIASDGIVLDKLAAGLGAKLESLSLDLSLETEQQKRQFGRVLRSLSENCPNLVHFAFQSVKTKVTDTLIRFISTQQQLVYLSLTIDVSDDLIGTIASSCLNLKDLRFWIGDIATTRCFQYLATGPYLRVLQILRYMERGAAENNAIAEKDIIHFLRHRGRNLEHIQFPNDQNCPLAPLFPFCQTSATLALRTHGTLTKTRMSSRS